MAVESRTVLLVLVALIALSILAVAAYQGYLAVTRPPRVEVKVEERIPQTEYLKLVLRNALNTSAISGASVYVYSSAEELLGSTTSISTGEAAPQITVTVGRSYYVWITKGNTVWEELITITEDDYVDSEKKFVKTISMTLQPPAGHSNVTLIVLDPDYNKISNGGEYNVTTQGNTKPEFTIMFSNKYLYTQLNKVVSELMDATYQPAFVIRVTGAGVTVSGLSTLYTHGANDVSYYALIDPEDTKCTKDPLTGEVTYGQTSTTLSVDASSLSSGSSVTVTVTVYANLDIDYFKGHGTANDNAVAIATLTFYIKA